MVNGLRPRGWSRSKQSRRGLAEQKHGKPCARQTKQQQKRRDQQAGVLATELIEDAIVPLPSIVCTEQRITAVKFEDYNRRCRNSQDCWGEGEFKRSLPIAANFSRTGLTDSRALRLSPADVEAVQ